jgi:UDP-N-acetylmuramoyl-L-alanyl-D-glutamate--2,6-diaminopimelate ligase
MEEYGEAKLDFFRLLREQHGFGVVNADDAWGDRFRAVAPDETWRFSESNPDAEVYAERMDIERDATTMDVRTPRGPFTTRLSMAGRFNAANALAAAALGVGLGAEPEAVGRALAGVDHVPGRYEVYRGVDITVIVDYAHTPEAIERVLLAVRDTGARRILCVFGCGGERDRTKRPEMARVAGTLSEIAILTTDNPRREPIDQIVADAVVGFDGTPACWERIDDRAAAIEHAIGEAEPGDVVCVLGKGDEEHILIGDQRIPFRDRDVVQRALAARDGSV